MSLKLYDWNRAITELRGTWIDLLDGGGFNPSLHPDWLGLSMTAKGMMAESRVVLAQTANGNTAILPVIFRRRIVSGLPMRCMDLCSNYMSYHAELLASGGFEDLLLEILTSKELPAWDVFRLDNLVSGGRTARAMDGLAAARAAPTLRYEAEQSPYISISAPWPDYLRSLSKKMRANITRCVRSTQQAGETGMVWYGHDGDVDRLFADILEVESLSWKASENTAIRPDTIEGRYHKLLLPWLERNGLMANVLYVREKPVAYVLCARWRGWVGQLKTSFSRDIRDAGFRVIQASIERAFAAGEREYDFLGDAAPHKLRWTDRIRGHEHRWLFARHWRGKALHAAKRCVDGLRRRSPATTDGTEETA